MKRKQRLLAAVLVLLVLAGCAVQPQIPADVQTTPEPPATIPSDQTPPEKLPAQMPEQLETPPEAAEIRIYAGHGTDAAAEVLANVVRQRTGWQTAVTQDSSQAQIVLSIGGGVADYRAAWQDGVLQLRGGSERALDMAVRAVKSRDLETLLQTKNPADATFLSGSLRTEGQQLSADELVIYPELPEVIRRDQDYTVTVTQGTQSHTIPVYNHTQDNYFSNRTVSGDCNRRFCQFAFSGQPVRVDIRVHMDFETYSVMPSAKGLETTYADGVISVYLDQPEYFTLRLDNDYDSVLSVFADAPEVEERLPLPGDEDVIYIDGWVQEDDGFLTVTNPGTTIYLAPGAVLAARVLIYAPEVTVCGRGVILDPFSNIFQYDIRKGGSEGRGTKLLTINGDRCRVEDVLVLDARCYNLAIHGDEVTVENFKALSTMITTDGISVYSGTGTTIKHCYLHVGDNALVLSAKDTVIEDVQIGTTCAAVFPQGSPENLLLRDLYVFRANGGIINHFWNEGRAQTASVTFENLDAVDCFRLPWLFEGRNMGTLEKTFVFRNAYLPETTGSTKLQMNTVGSMLRFLNNDSDLYTDCYTLDFTNLYVAGRRIDRREQLLVNDTGKENKLLFAADGTVSVPQHRAVTANYICPDPPAEETLPHNLLEDIGWYGSRWIEYAAYDVDLIAQTASDMTEYTVCNAEHKGVGMARMLTDMLRRSGDGTYLLTFEAKTEAAKGSGRMDVVLENEDGKSVSSIGLTPEWKQTSLALNVDRAMSVSVSDYLLLHFTTAQDDLAGFSVRNMTLIKQ